MWGVVDTNWNGGDYRINHAVVLSASGGLNEVAAPAASQPPRHRPRARPCRSPTPRSSRWWARTTWCSRCGRAEREVEWPRYQCYRLDDGTVCHVRP